MTACLALTQSIWSHPMGSLVQDVREDGEKEAEGLVSVRSTRDQMYSHINKMMNSSWRLGPKQTLNRVSCPCMP